MARIVVTSREVAHLWANKAQDTARNSNGSFHFTGAALYSYGAHYVIASHLDNGLMLWNDESRSNTTSGHQSHARNAVRHATYERALHVPALNENTLRQLERRRATDYKGAEMPDVIAACIERVIREVQSISNFRSIDKMNAALWQARTYQESAKALIAYVSHVGYRPRYPLPDVPESVPADKEARALLVRSFAKSQLMAEYREALQSIPRDLDRLHGTIIGPVSYNDQNLIGRHVGIGSAINQAIKAHETATGKKSASMAKLGKQWEALREPAKAKQDGFAMADAVARMRREMRMFYKFQHFAKRGTKPLYNCMPNWRDLEAMHRDCAGSDYDIAENAEIYRAIRVANVIKASKEFELAESQFKAAVSYMPQHPLDAKRHYKTALNALTDASECSAFYMRNATRIDEMRLAADLALSTINHEIRIKNEGRIQAWISGETNHLPFEAGTYARIDASGTAVVTSRGARVPIEHACRLARLARLAMRRGGQTWTNDDGPMVGHYRVNAIGADGSAVIGCHDFDGAEGTRLLALLESCTACQSATVETE